MRQSGYFFTFPPGWGQGANDFSELYAGGVGLPAILPMPGFELGRGWVVGLEVEAVGRSVGAQPVEDFGGGDVEVDGEAKAVVGFAGR